MKIMTMAALTAACTTSALQASTLTGDYLALPTYSIAAGYDVSFGFVNSIYPDLDPTYVIDEPGLMSFDGDGNATLSMSVFNRDNGIDGFAIEMTFDQNYAISPAFKDVFGRFDEPSNITLFNLAAGTLTGIGGFAGLTMDVGAFPDPDGAATQVGGGTGNGSANGHNENFGMAVWFEVLSFEGADICAYCIGNPAFDNLIGEQVDIVIDLEPAPVPLPAGGVLALTALAGLAALRRR